MLANRLVDHALGKNKMSATQVRAAEVMLRKTLPDLAAIQHSGELGVRHCDVSANPLTPDEWDKQYGERLNS